MLYRLSVEDMEPDHWIAWALDLPGCYSRAASRDATIAQAPNRIAAYFDWLADYDCAFVKPAPPYEVEVVEEWRAVASADDPAYLVNAFFAHDQRPLRPGDIEQAFGVLRWSRRDLLNLVQSLPAERLAQPMQGNDHGSIGGILAHLAGAENWYFDLLGLGLNRSALPDDPLAQLDLVRANTRAQLIKLIGDARIVDERGERWSARKVLRRTLWHERDHTQQIAALLRQSAA